MAESNLGKLNIPPEAIRTMKKDLSGITRGEWDLTLAEVEIQDLLQQFRQRQQELEAQRMREQQAQKPQEKKPEPQKEELPEKKEEIVLPKKEEIIKKEPEKELETEKISGRDKVTIEEIRRRARKREELVNQRMEKEGFKKALESEEKAEAETKAKSEKELREKLAWLQRALQEIPAEKIPLEENQSYFLKEQAKIEKELEPILESEKKIEENIKFIEGIEKTAITPRQKKKAEQERQLAEQERETIEKQRWDYEQKKFQIEKQLKEIEFGFNQIAQKEAKIKQEIDLVNQELEKVDKAKEKEEIEIKIEQLAKEKQESDTIKAKILTQRQEIEERLAEVMMREQKLEKELSYIGEEERLSGETDKQRIEQERWKLEKTRSDIEKERWLVEEDKTKIRLEENRINVRYEKILEQENQYRKRIQDINQILGIIVPKEVLEPRQKQEPDLKLQEEPIQKDEYREEKPAAERLKSDRAPSPIKTDEETQKKDPEESTEKKTKPGEETEQEKAKEELAKIEAKQRREELLKKLREVREREAQNKEKQLLQRIRQGTSPEPSAQPPLQHPPFMNLPSERDVKKSKLRLLLIIAAVVVIIGIIGFWYWYVKIRPEEEPSPSPTPPITSPSPTPTDNPTVEPLIMPASLIQVNTTFPLKAANQDEILLIIKQILKNKDIVKDTFSRVSMEDTVNNKYFSVAEILASLGYTPPQNLFNQFDGDSTIFVFPTNDFSALGFASKIATSSSSGNIMTIMKSWEPNLINDTRKFGTLLGKTNMVPIANFQQNNYKNNVIRFLTLSPGPDCFGACYATANNKFYFSTCCKSITNLIDSSQ